MPIREGRALSGPVPGKVDDVAYIGDVLKRSRHGRFTVEELSTRAGVSSGLISRLERGRGNPSLVTLLKLAYALDLPVGALFQAAGHDDERLVVRRSERRQLVLQHEGLVYELLTPGVHGKLAMLRTRIPGLFQNHERPFVHPGEECLAVQSGRLAVVVGDQRYVLEEGDSITYAADIPHWFQNPEREEVILIGAVTPPSF